MFIAPQILCSRTLTPKVVVLGDEGFGTYISIEEVIKVEPSRPSIW